MYAPDLDGRADPGEIVWTWVVYEDDPTRGKDRPVLVVGRDRSVLLGLMVSSQEHHAAHPHWVGIGSGEWDYEGRPSWVRLDRVLDEASKDIPLAKEWDLEVLNGVEITHVPARKIDMVVSKARLKGAQIVVIHGETISEPVEKGTNLAAVSNPEIDILAHPGFITVEEAELAKKNGVALEITSRSSHNKTNGHVARIARQVGAKMVLDTDTHSPGDIIDEQTAMVIARAAGLTDEEAHRACYETPEEIVRRRSLY